MSIPIVWSLSPREQHFPKNTKKDGSDVHKLS
jgi:hypothetical protein